MLKVETGKAKASFSALKKQARTQDVAITKHGKVEAYLVSPERYDRFVAVAETAPDSLRKLEDEYRRRFEQMQTPVARKAYRELMTLPLETILAEGTLAEPAKAAGTKQASAPARRAGARR